MIRFLAILGSVACWVLRATGWILTVPMYIGIYLWFFPIMLSMVADGSYAREKLREQNNEYWYKKHGINQWLRQFERQQHKKRAKSWKKRNIFYK